MFYVVITDEVALGRDGTESIVRFFRSVGGFYNTLGPSDKNWRWQEVFSKRGNYFLVVRMFGQFPEARYKI
jgi:hypothetical protein